MTTMFAANFEDRDDADGTLLSSAAAGGEGGVDADCGFTPFAATLPLFDATAAVGEEGMAVATTYDDDDVWGVAADGGIVALGGGASSSSSDDPFGVGGGYGIGIVVAPSPPRMGMQPPMMQSQARQSSRQMQTTAYGQPQQQQGQVQPLDPFEGGYGGGVVVVGPGGPPPPGPPPPSSSSSMDPFAIASIPPPSRPRCGRPSILGDRRK